MLFKRLIKNFESQRFQLHQASRRADQAQRDKISLYGELELRNRLFHEDNARDCQEIEELRRICCEETDRARQARIHELSFHRERKPTTVSQLMAQFREVQNKVNSLSDAGEFYDPESRSSSGATHVPDRTSTILSPRTLLRCDSGLPRNTLNGTGITGNVFERPSAQEGVSSTVFNNSKNLASSSQGLGPDTTETARKESGMKRESLTTSIQPLHFQNRSSMLNHTGGTYSHYGMMDFPRIPITEWNLGTFLHSMEFESWKVNFRTEVCLRTADPKITMLWIKEIEIPESIDELMTSRSITERHDFLDYDMLDAMIASALKKFLNTHIHFRKK